MTARSPLQALVRRPTIPTVEAALGYASTEQLWVDSSAMNFDGNVRVAIERHLERPAIGERDSGGEIVPSIQAIPPAVNKLVFLRRNGKARGRGVR
jgi:hypothetical protein